MNCPIDGMELKITVRQGVEIDYCPKCRGIWLDRGELDKLLERESQYYSEQAGPARPQAPAAAPRPTVVVVDDDDDDDYKYRRNHPQEYPGYEKRKRKSFLGDLFDVFD